MTALFGLAPLADVALHYVASCRCGSPITNVAKETHTTIVPPLLLFTRRGPEASLTTVLGLFWHHHDVTSSTTLGLPLYYDFHDFSLSRTTVAFPLLFRHANEVAGTATVDRAALLPPLVAHGLDDRRLPALLGLRGPGTRTTIVFPLFAHWRRPDHASTWVFPTIYHRTGLAPAGQPDGTWHTVVAPFYAAAVKRPGDFSWEVLGGLFGHESVGRNRYLKLFFMRFEQEPAPRAQTAWYSQPRRRHAAPAGRPRPLDEFLVTATSGSDSEQRVEGLAEEVGARARRRGRSSRRRRRGRRGRRSGARGRARRAVRGSTSCATPSGAGRRREVRRRAARAGSPTRVATIDRAERARARRGCRRRPCRATIDVTSASGRPRQRGERGRERARALGVVGAVEEDVVADALEPAGPAHAREPGARRPRAAAAGRERRPGALGERDGERGVRALVRARRAPSGDRGAARSRGPARSERRADRARRDARDLGVGLGRQRAEDSGTPGLTMPAFSRAISRSVSPRTRCGRGRRW